MKKLFFGYLLFVFSVVHCSQAGEKVKEEQIEKEEKNKETVKKEWEFTQTDLNIGYSSNPVLYSLQENKVVDYKLKLTKHWDIEFIKIDSRNIVIRPNNKELESSSGNGGLGRAQIHLYKDEEIENQYFSVIENAPRKAPERRLFNKIFDDLWVLPEKLWWVNNEGRGKELKTEVKIGAHRPNSQEGWYYYDASGSMLKNRARTKKPHVVYALPRIIIVKTAKEEAKWAKLIITSRYKGNLEYPAAEDKLNFISFRYAFNLVIPS